jgi:membrane protein DedA with SNARE-associated domain
MFNFAILYYLGLALLSVLQGPIVILLGAAAAATGVISPYGVFIAVTIGNLSVDLLWFMIGRLGKVAWITRFRWLRVNLNTIESMKGRLFHQTPQIVALAKLSSIFVLPVMVAAGLVRLPWKRWFPTLFIVEIVKNVLLILLGYYAVVSISQLQKGLSILAISGSILSIIIPMWLFRRSMHTKDKAAKLDQEEKLKENKPLENKSLENKI